MGELRMQRNRFILLAIVMLALAGRGFAEPLPELPPASPQPVDYARDIRPLLAKRCAECHGGDAQESGFRVDARESFVGGGDSGEPAVLVGNSRESEIVQRVAGIDPALAMPPDAEPLTAEQIGLLRAWIDQGLPMPEGESLGGDSEGLSHWSLQPIVRLSPPAIESSTPRTPVDAFILARLHREGLDLSPPAERRVLIRRLFLDVLGVLPAPERVESFIRDSRPDAYERLVDEVLADPHHGERWARHWLDVVRFAESDGFETNHERPNAYHYRDYVIRALNDDKPFDRFVYEQLAGDAVGVDAATGFIVGGAHDIVSSPDPALTAMQRQDELADIVNTTSTAFLGLTVGCARCHNHKFDAITQKDYYALQAVFAGVQHGERPIQRQDAEESRTRTALLAEELEAVEADFERLISQPNQPIVRAPVSAKRNVERFAPRMARLVRMTIAATNNGIAPCVDELEVWSVPDEGEPRTNVALTATRVRSSGNYPGGTKHKLEHINDGRYGNSYSWISDTPNEGWVELEFDEPVLIDRITWGRDREGKYSDRLPVDYRIEVAVEPDDWHAVASSDDRLSPDSQADLLQVQLSHLSPDDAEQARRLATRRERLEQQLAEWSTPPVAYAGQFETPAATHRLYRGDPLAPREQVAPDTVTALGSLGLSVDAPEQQRRVALAESFIAADNPLTARVMANRLWQHHFGRGLVATSSDFGAMGAEPSHPELLDWLASELRDGPTQPESATEATRSWSLKHLHRLILLSATYRQSSRPTAKGMAVDAGSSLLWRYPPRRLEAEAIRDNILLVSGTLDRRMEGAGFMMFQPNSNYARNWIAKDEFGPPEFRRMLYATKLRMEKDAVFGAFDCPDAGQTAPQRPRSTTPLQSLNLLNSDFVIDQAQRFASMVDREVGDATPERVMQVFQLALGRDPGPDELDAAVELVDQHGLDALCRAIYNTNGFLFLR